MDVFATCCLSMCRKLCIFQYESNWSNETFWNCFLDEPCGAKVIFFSFHFDASKWGKNYVSRGCLAWFHGNNLNNQPRQNVVFCLEGLHFLLDAPTHQATCWSSGTWTMTACHDRQKRQGVVEHKSKETPKKMLARWFKIQNDHFIPKRSEVTSYITFKRVTHQGHHPKNKVTIPELPGSVLVSPVVFIYFSTSRNWWLPNSLWHLGEYPKLRATGYDWTPKTYVIIAIQTQEPPQFWYSPGCL